MLKSLVLLQEEQISRWFNNNDYNYNIEYLGIEPRLFRVHIQKLIDLHNSNKNNNKIDWSNIIIIRKNNIDDFNNINNVLDFLHYTNISIIPK